MRMVTISRGVLAGVLAVAQPAVAQGPEPPLLVVLTPTGHEAAGLPVFTRHPAAERWLTVLTHGFDGRVLRLYRWVQRRRLAREGRAIEPAYLLLSDRQGGFARVGFRLDGVAKPDADYVDLHRRMRLAGWPGAMDQIFPHEMMHVLMRHVAGELPAGAGGANQMHAIGVRTDPQTAFEEGFAEHAQVMAIDDPDAWPETAATARDPWHAARAEWQLAAYERSLSALWAPATPHRLGFLLWFSHTEQVMRYQFVKANRFARARVLPERVLLPGDPYAAYLLDNVLPGRIDDPLKPAPRLLATEGAVASLFWRWATSEALGRAYRDDAFYRSRGTARADVSPLDNAYLKLFHAIEHSRRRDTSRVVRAYVDLFPEDAAAVRAVVESAGLPWPLREVPALWLANRSFVTGTSLFDQFRTLPRPHTFDLNAASLPDLLTVPGITRKEADALLAHAPYADLAAVDTVPGVSAAVRATLRDMAGEMNVRRAGGESGVERLSLTAIVRSYLLRAGLWIALCAALGALVFRKARPTAWWRGALNGVAASTVGLFATWVLTTAGDHAWTPLLPFLPVAVFGVPAAAWQLLRRRLPRRAALALAAWGAACVPAWLVTRPLF